MAGYNTNIGGDFAGYECSKCDSDDTTFEEYVSSYEDSSQIGIICEDCGHAEDPDEFSQRFEDDRPDIEIEKE